MHHLITKGEKILLGYHLGQLIKINPIKGQLEEDGEQHPRGAPIPIHSHSFCELVDIISFKS